MNINNVVIIGRLCQDPVLKPAGKSVCCNVSLAVSGMQKDDTSFIPVVIWGKSAEFVSKYCIKGDRIGIKGRLQQDKWTDKEGKNQSAIKVIAESVELLQAKRPDQQTHGEVMNSFTDSFFDEGGK